VDRCKSGFLTLLFNTYISCIAPDGEELSAVWIFEKLQFSSFLLLIKDMVLSTFLKAHVAQNPCCTPPLVYLI
jgi:hypothetical protein